MVTNRDKQTGWACLFKGPRPWSTTLVCRAGSCPLLNDAIIAVCKRKTVRKEKITERVEKMICSFLQQHVLLFPCTRACVRAAQRRHNVAIDTIDTTIILRPSIFEMVTTCSYMGKNIGTAQTRNYRRKL